MGSGSCPSLWGADGETPVRARGLGRASDQLDVLGDSLRTLSRETGARHGAALLLPMGSKAADSGVAQDRPMSPPPSQCL